MRKSVLIILLVIVLSLSMVQGVLGSSASDGNPGCTPPSCTGNCGDIWNTCTNSLMSCGTCSEGDVCYNNLCCTPQNCSDLGKECGTWDNGCGGTVNCGTCTSGEVCSSGTCVELDVCGNGFCESGEQCDVCSDCGSCPTETTGDNTITCDWGCPDSLRSYNCSCDLGYKPSCKDSLAKISCSNYPGPYYVPQCVCTPVDCTPSCEVCGPGVPAYKCEQAGHPACCDCVPNSLPAECGDCIPSTSCDSSIECGDCEDGCGGTIPAGTCNSGETCNLTTGKCEVTCSDDCTAGATQCSGTDVQTCGYFDADSCLDWSTPTSCGAGQYCSGGSCVDYCGNGNLNNGEECDDGNTANGDNCSSTCTVEPGHTSCSSYNPGDTRSCTASGEQGICQDGLETCQSNWVWSSCVAGNPQNEGLTYGNTCSDDLDNDCDGKCDYDSSTCVKGDNGCLVAVTAISVSTSDMCLGSSMTITCTSSVSDVNSIKASLGGNTCNFIVGSWSGNQVNFTCNPSSTGSLTAKCEVDSTKSYVSGSSKSTTVSVSDCGCGVYGNSANCEANVSCDWVSLSCDGTKTYNGGLTGVCVDHPLTAVCLAGSCSAECDLTNGGCSAGVTCLTDCSCDYGPEVCDNIDNDGNGLVDDGLSRTSSCGVGECYNSTSQSCSSGSWNPVCTPGTPVTEICGDGKDNDCDGFTDEDCGVCDNDGTVDLGEECDSTNHCTNCQCDSGYRSLDGICVEDDCSTSDPCNDPVTPFNISNDCYYSDACVSNKCEYYVDSNKQCTSSTCTATGWDNSACAVCDNDGTVDPGEECDNTADSHCTNCQCDSGYRYVSEVNKCLKDSCVLDSTCAISPNPDEDVCAGWDCAGVNCQYYFNKTKQCVDSSCISETGWNYEDTYWDNSLCGGSGTCGDKSLNRPNADAPPINEDCDSGLNCAVNCSCDSGFIPTTPYSVDCARVGSVCGDGIRDEPNLGDFMEECDDGNTDNNDGCSSTCQNESACASASNPECVNNDDCANEYCDQETCTCEIPPPPPCGNGVVDSPEEECDPAATNTCGVGEQCNFCQCVPDSCTSSSTETWPSTCTDRKDNDCNGKCDFDIACNGAFEPACKFTTKIYINGVNPLITNPGVLSGDQLFISCEVVEANRPSNFISARYDGASSGDCSYYGVDGNKTIFNCGSISTSGRYTAYCDVDETKANGVDSQANFDVCGSSDLYVNVSTDEGKPAINAKISTTYPDVKTYDSYSENGKYQYVGSFPIGQRVVITSSLSTYRSAVEEFTMDTCDDYNLDMVLDGRACYDDCTDWQNICKASCNGISGCDYNKLFSGDESIKNACDGVKKDYWVKYNDTHRVYCCGATSDGSPRFQEIIPEKPQFSGCMKNLVQKTRLLNYAGEPTKVLLVVWPECN